MRAIALEYHDVVGSEGFDASGFAGADAATYKLRAEAFERHLAAIARAVARPPATTPPNATSGDRGAPLLLTFDDGGVSAYTRIAPLLETRGWRGIFLVTTDFIGAATFLSEDQIRSLRARGHVIGSHSCSHPTRMAHCGWDELEREWQASAGRLADILGEPVTVASVPGGYYARRVAEAAARAGIRTLFTSEPTTRAATVHRCAVLGRYTLRRDSTPATAAALAAGRPMPRAAQWIVWNAKKIAKAVAGRGYLRVREALLRS